MAASTTTDAEFDLLKPLSVQTSDLPKTATDPNVGFTYMMSSLAKYENQLHHLVSESWDEEANLIFRGQADREWPLESSADRRLRKVTPRDVIEYVIERLLHPARDEGYGHHAGKPLSDLELLATLQHHGAATCLIDFTSNFHIALWFACQDHQLDGSVFVVNRGDADSFQTITGERTGLEIAKILEDDGAVDSPDEFCERAQWATHLLLDATAQRDSIRSPTRLFRVFAAPHTG